MPSFKIAGPIVLVFWVYVSFSQTFLKLNLGVPERNLTLFRAAIANYRILW